ncbi:MAG TPA: NAD(P)/FAD-dependent oxidoreductase [Blastocatellia bacterium]|nr:NAD(P)/FAD-dependent oxidoreductase [Blastocatellia bacterium]
MQVRSAEIAIIGAGPAGAHLATRLSADGRDVVLFDPKGAWEKPCGGGVPTRALREFDFILKSSGYPKKLIRRITMISPLNRQVSLTLEEPFAVYSRQVLNGLVLDRALAAGARFVREAVCDFSRDRDGWVISTDAGNQYRTSFLVGADGAASFTRRRLVGIFPKQDLALAFGYNIRDDESPSSGNGDAKRRGPAVDEVVVRFPRDFTGYLWAFPRPGVMNFGVASKLGERTSDELRALLTDFVCDCYGGSMPEPERVSFFGAKIPTLDMTSWRELQTIGDGWALIGDAAGFADPITGEGIYYAFKSADLLADALSHARSTNEPLAAYERAASSYENMWREAFGRDLEHASYRLPHFYHGRFIGRIFTDAMVMLARHHRGVRTILGRALVGEQSYVTLKRDLLRRAWQVL